MSLRQLALCIACKLAAAVWTAASLASFRLFCLGLCPLGRILGLGSNLSSASIRLLPCNTSGVEERSGPHLQGALVYIYSLLATSQKPEGNAWVRLFSGHLSLCGFRGKLRGNHHVSGAPKNRHAHMDNSTGSSPNSHQHQSALACCQMLPVLTLQVPHSVGENHGYLFCPI